MIVELCGVPGSGKSFLARALAHELTARGHRVSLPLEPVSPRRPSRERMLRKVRWAAFEALTHPLGSTKLVRLVYGSRQPSVRDVAVRSLNWLVLRAALRRARASSAIHIIDQGIIGELGSVAYRGRGSTAVNAANPGRDRLAPDLVLMVHAGASVANRRLEARPGAESRIEQVAMGRVEALTRQAALLDDLLDEWTAQFGHRLPTQVQRVDNSDDAPDPDVEALAAILLASPQPLSNSQPMKAAVQ